jgi:putative addiction module CopG family antidote
MNIALKKQFQDWIDNEVKSGRYSSETEVVEEALREKIEKEEAERLWERIQESERQIDRGEYVVADDAFFERKRQMIRDRYMKPEK